MPSCYEKRRKQIIDEQKQRLLKHFEGQQFDLTGMKEIASGTYGDIYQLSERTVVKMSYDPDDAVFEASVMLDLAPVHELCENFVRLQGFVIKDDKSYILMDNLVGTVTLNSLITSLTEVDLNDILLQLLFALQQANNPMKFTHHDLHIENIMIKTLDHPQERTVIGKKITTKYIPYIIDLQFSYLRAEYEHYYIPTTWREKNDLFDTPGIDLDRNCPWYDIFKFLASMVLKDLNEKVKTWLRKMFSVMGEIDSYEKRSRAELFVDLYKPTFPFPSYIMPEDFALII